MRRLYLYLTLTTLPRAAGALLLICVVYASIDLVEAGSMAGVPAGDLLAAYPLKLPSIAAQILPLALLFGVLLALSSLRRGGEWDALRSAGLSPLRLSPGLLAVPLLGFMIGAPIVEWLGPAGLARFESAVAGGERTDQTRAQWSVGPGGSLIRSEGRNTARIVIERDAEGRAVGFRGRGDRVWRHGQGWSVEHVAAAADTAVLEDREAALSAGQFAGADLTRVELVQAIDDLEGRGQDASPLTAQGALRLALIAACVLVPLLGLLVALGWREDRASRLIALGLAVGAAYWLALATAWNGAVLGAWSALWVSVGVPALFGAIALLVGVRTARVR